MAPYRGLDERALAERLITALPASAAAALRWGSTDLRTSAEHLLYTRLVRPPATATTRFIAARSIGRILRSAFGAAPASPRLRGSIFVLITQPIHGRLFRPVGEILDSRGMPWLMLDAETREGRSAGTAARLADYRVLPHVASLIAHATAVATHLAHPVAEWDGLVAEARARELSVTLTRGLPLVALEAARLRVAIQRHAPALVVCFSESGMLARVAPAASWPLGIPVVDLPHAEAADPSGTVGAGYQGVAVYGPRAAAAMALAGIDPATVVEIGPLGKDALQRAARDPDDGPRRVVFASQPMDASRPNLHPDVIRTALASAVASAEQLAPAQLIVIRHPTQSLDEVEGLLRDVRLPEGLAAHVERDRTLHEILPGAWLMVTASSQSVFDALLSGVPAMVVNPTGSDPTGFGADGIAIAVGSAEEATTWASELRNPDRRTQAVGRARQALGNRIGPLDGRAAERAADWLIAMSRPDPAPRP